MARLPKDVAMEDVTLEQAIEMVDAKSGKGGVKAKAAPKKKAAKKPTKKTAKKKATQPKAKPESKAE